jgi:hypothetical protein
MRFAPYATEQLRERGLSLARVRDAIEHPDQLLEGKGDRRIAQKRVRDAGQEYLLRVIFEDADGDVLVITAYATSKVAKYWRKE